MGLTTVLLTSGCGYLPVTRNKFEHAIINMNYIQALSIINNRKYAEDAAKERDLLKGRIEQQTKQIIDMNSIDAKQTEDLTAYSGRLTKIEKSLENQALSIINNRKYAEDAAKERDLLKGRIDTLEDLSRRDPEIDINGTHSEDMWYNHQKIHGVRVFYRVCEGGKKIVFYEITKFGETKIRIEPGKFNQIVKKAKDHNSLIESLQRYYPSTNQQSQNSAPRHGVL